MKLTTVAVRFENVNQELQAAMMENEKTRAQRQFLLQSFKTSPIAPSAPYDIRPYLNSISDDMKEMIHNVYKHDFITFGYSYLGETVSDNKSKNNSL